MDLVLDRLRDALKDRYRVDGEIGRGGMATVFGAEDLRHGRRVAIKVLSPDLAASIGSERFTREIRIAARLQHPNILTVFDSGDADGLLYYVMPFVEGESLRDRMQRETYISVDDAIQIACETAEALSYAHAQGVVHRDIKPENILLQNGRVLVADFGIARNTDKAEERLTGTGMSIGTAAYMSPEQSAGEVVDARSDIYALGCTSYEMLAGQPPFTGPNPLAVMSRHAFEPVPSIRVVRASVPAELEAAVFRSLEKLPADRFQTMDEFRRAVLGEIPSGGTRETSRYTARYRTPAAVQAKAPPRNAMAFGVATGLLLLIAAGVAFANRKDTQPPIDADQVAVLYFDDQGKPSLRYLADGLTESLIDQLSGVAAISVVSSNGVRAFRGTSIGIDSIARALKVGSLVRGSLEPEGAKVRVSVALVDASGASVDRTSVVVDTTDIVAAQRTIAARVADYLRERIGNEVRLRTDRASTASSAAWTLVERANKLRKDADSLNAAGGRTEALALLARADSLLEQAESHDARWSKIPARRASLAYRRMTLNAAQPAVSLALSDSGLVFARRALRLQPNDADALEAKGQIEFTRYDQRLEADPRRADQLLAVAETTLMLAVDLNKAQAGAWATLSSLYYRKPDIQAANHAASKAYDADAYLASARLILTRLFWTSHDLELFPEAMKWCNEGRRRFPTDALFTACRLWMSTTRYERPDVDSAWIYAAKYVALTPEPNRPYAAKLSRVLVGGALARAGLADSARHVLLSARATPVFDPQRELEGYEAVMRVILGDHDEAVHLIADYLSVHPTHRKGFATRTGWWWRDLQSNRKFQALLAGAK